ncbi:hypothetical protein BHE74_00023254 [Ensete ventricosum]|nr:hypothetical protein BHE74_00023254 [Ensete ventricosum]RZR82872.1 hypothetical protein BHM03_00009400 [Ensete ventricosum]
MARPRPRPHARGRLAAARASPQGRPTSLAGVAARKGGACGHDQLRPTCRGSSRRGHTLLQRDTRNGDRLQGACKGLSPAASPAASKGDGADRRGGYRRARAAAACAGPATAAQMGQEGLGHPFEKRTILPL